MVLSADDKADLVNMMRAAVSEGCMCGHKDDVMHLMGRMKTLGDGNIEKGIESFSKTIGAFTWFRKLGERLGGLVAEWLLKALLVALLACLAAGILTRLRGGLGL